MKRVYIGVYGVGLGHASRMVQVADRLKNDKLLRFSSFGDAVEYIRTHGYSCIRVPSVEFGWDPNQGFDVVKSIRRLPINFFNFINQCAKESNNIGRFRPNVIVSDTRLSSLVAAHLYNIPTITIINQVKLILSNGLREYSITRMFEDILAEFLGYLWRSSDEVLIPDLPPPYTLSQDNLWNIATISNRLKYIGFLIPQPNLNEENVIKVRRMLQLDGKPTVFAHISGPSDTKPLLIKSIIDSIGDDVNLIVSEGRPNGNVHPKKIRNGWYYEWCPVRDEIFATSELLIVRGGHSTLSQCILYGKPVISIPIENHGEQIGNAKKIERLGLGMVINDINRINEYINNILDDDKYKSNISKVREITYKLNGLATIINKINEYLSR